MREKLSATLVDVLDSARVELVVVTLLVVLVAAEEGPAGGYLTKIPHVKEDGTEDEPKDDQSDYDIGYRSPDSLAQLT